MTLYRLSHQGSHIYIHIQIIIASFNITTIGLKVARKRYSRDLKVSSSLQGEKGAFKKTECQEVPRLPIPLPYPKIYSETNHEETNKKFHRVEYSTRPLV